MSRVKHKYHYFYRITNKLNNHYYYGVHSTDDLEDGYMGSGSRLRYAYKEYGIENFTKEILKFFDTREKANEYEAKVVNEELLKDENCYNLIKGGGFDTSGMATVKDKDGNTFSVSIDDPRYLSGELVGTTKDRIAVIDKDGKRYLVSKDDPRYLSGELIGAKENEVIVKDSSNKYFCVSKDDPRYLSRELGGYTKGRVLVRDTNNRYYQISKDDPRYLSGELKTFWTGRKHRPEAINKMKETHKKNKHQQGEKNSQYGTCWIHDNEKSIRIKKEELDKYLENGWIRGRKMKF